MNAELMYRRCYWNDNIFGSALVDEETHQIHVMVQRTFRLTFTLQMGGESFEFTDLAAAKAFVKAQTNFSQIEVTGK